jgi:hypothetical protein
LPGSELFPSDKAPVQNLENRNPSFALLEKPVFQQLVGGAPGVALDVDTTQRIFKPPRKINPRSKLIQQER